MTAALVPAVIFLSGCSYIFYPTDVQAQEPGSLVYAATLADEVYETSGLVCHDGLLVTINDSGGDPVLYVLDTAGTLLNEITITPAVNRDWESLAADDRHIYIGDFGNNYGTRDTLAIYLVDMPEDLLNVNRLRVRDSITFSFNETTSKQASRGLYSHDMEAFLAYRDSLFLYSKDWVSYDARIYAIPAVGGHYSLKARSTYPAGFAVTGADILPSEKEVVLIGYRNAIPCITRYTFDQTPGYILSAGKVNQYPVKAGTQIEGVSYSAEGEILVTAEKQVKKQALYRVK